MRPAPPAARRAPRGNAGGFVASWLEAGTHRFTTTLITTSGQHALTGTWVRAVGKTQAGAYAGTWSLTIDSTGWRIRDPKNTGNYIDVAYLAANRLQLRAGSWTTPVENQGGKGWCSDTNVPVTYSWALSGATLTLALAGKDGCGGQHFIIAGDWTRR